VWPRQGFEDVKAYRLPPPFSRYTHARRYREHLYRHRLGDDTLDITVDEPALMLYIDLDQFKRKRRGEESEKEDDDDGEGEGDEPMEVSHTGLGLHSLNITR
jgi:hypothetical protein